ncbi:MAG TPA: BON domain-containing protein [Candidatus Acidoferrales bacterium]|nr:BON domain-containing protein [Candidatus Acidoferrales bacterium]
MRSHIRSCILVMLVAALAACSPQQQERARSTANDAIMAGEVRARLAGVDPATVSLVNVDVNARRVTLTGQVHSEQERVAVDQAVRGISGIAGLDDRLKVNPNAPTANEIAADLALQARVQAAIAAQTGVNALKITVSAHHGVVTLSGTVTSWAAHTLVVQSARGVSGVTRLIDRIHLQR